VQDRPGRRTRRALPQLPQRRAAPQPLAPDPASPPGPGPAEEPLPRAWNLGQLPLHGSLRLSREANYWPPFSIGTASSTLLAAPAGQRPACGPTPRCCPNSHRRGCSWTPRFSVAGTAVAGRGQLRGGLGHVVAALAGLSAPEP